MKHSPTPWRTEKNLGGNYRIVADGCWLDGRFGAGHSRVVAETRMHFGSEDPEVDGNAEFIVRAANCHDELLEALERLECAADYMADHYNCGLCNEAIDQARAAIAKAKGKMT